MLSLVKAMSPPAMNTSKPSRTIGGRVSPNVSGPFNTDDLSIRSETSRRRPIENSSACGRGQRVAQEQRAFGGDQLAHLHALDDLPVALARQRDPDRAPGEAAAVG